MTLSEQVQPMSLSSCAEAHSVQEGKSLARLCEAMPTKSAVICYSTSSDSPW